MKKEDIIDRGSGQRCPKCGKKTVVIENGRIHCTNCGFERRLQT